MNSGREESLKQEEAIKSMFFRCYRQKASGATRFQKGDNKTEELLFEAKTSLTPQRSYRVDKEKVDKIRTQAMSMNRKTWCLVFDFGPEENNPNRKRYFGIVELWYLAQLYNAKEESKEQVRQLLSKLPTMAKEDIAEALDEILNTLGGR